MAKLKEVEIVNSRTNPDILSNFSWIFKDNEEMYKTFMIGEGLYLITDENNPLVFDALIRLLNSGKFKTNSINIGLLDVKIPKGNFRYYSYLDNQGVKRTMIFLDLEGNEFLADELK